MPLPIGLCEGFFPQPLHSLLPSLLLVNRYVPLAVAVLAPVLVKILTFHALMAPSGLPLALFVAVLWALILIEVRPAFSGLFQPRLQPGA
jgi:putative oxidoreductase